MISKRMYTLLSNLPRDYATVPYLDVIDKSGLSREEFIQCKIANSFLGNDTLFYTSGEVSPEKNTVGLTDRGLAEVEAYEQEIENRKTTKATLDIARYTLKATIFAVVVAIVSMFISLSH